MTTAEKSANGYAAICYHYIRPDKSDLFPRILGTKQDVFNKHIKALKKEFQIISLSEAIEFSRGSVNFKKERPGLLFTFDDALSDHYTAARILAEHNIKAVFFIPTCVLTDNLPINPVIIHYCLAHYGIDEFLRVYRDALDEYNINFDGYPVTFKKGTDNPMETIVKIKKIFKYSLPPADSRKILLFIYKNLFEKDFPQALKIMHLTKEQIQEMLDMGHSIGSHTHSHISIASFNLNDEDFKKEVLFPKEYLENTFKTDIKAFSYPFGEVQDYAGLDESIQKTRAYKLAFTVEKILNTTNVSPFKLGRHSPRSEDSAQKALKDLRTLSHI